METKVFFQFEIIINVLVRSFFFIWIPMLWFYSRYKYFIFFSVGSDYRRQDLTSTDVRFWRLNTLPALWGFRVAECGTSGSLRVGGVGYLAPRSPNDACRGYGSHCSKTCWPLNPCHPGAVYIRQPFSSWDRFYTLTLGLPGSYLYVHPCANRVVYIH